MNGIPYNSMGSHQSNYVVSNDRANLSMSEMSNLSPRPVVPTKNKPMNNGPELATPTLIPPLKYIVYNNPQAAYNFLVNMGYSVRPEIPSTYQFAKLYIRERGEQGILDIVRAAHPDLETIFKAFNMKPKEESTYQETPAASTQPVANPPAATAPEKTEKGGIKMTANTIILILIFVIFIILVTRK